MTFMAHLLHKITYTIHYTLYKMLPIQSENLQEVLIEDGSRLRLYGMFLLYSALVSILYTPALAPSATIKLTKSCTRGG